MKYYLLITVLIVSLSDAYAEVRGISNCSPLLSESSISPSEVPLREAYLSLLNLVLAGIDEIDTHAFGYIDKAKVKLQLLQTVSSSEKPVHPLYELQNLKNGTSSLTYYSAKLSTLADSGQFDFVVANLEAESWAQIQKAVGQRLAEWQSLNQAQKIEKPATQEDFNDELDFNKENRLFRLIRARRFDDVFSILKSARITPHYLNHRNAFNQTALDVLASLTKDRKLYRRMGTMGALRGKRLWKLENEFLEAISKGDISKINDLYNHGIDVNFAHDRLSAMPLFIALSLRLSPEVIRTLIKLGADPELKDYDRTPLVYAIEKRASVASVEALLEGQPNLDITYDGLNIFELAVTNGRADLMELFASKGFSTKISRIGQIQNCEAVVKKLLDLNVDLNAKTLFGSSTLLHEAIVTYNLFLVRALLSNGADPELPDNFGNTPEMLNEKSNRGERFFKVFMLLKTYIDKKHGRGDPLKKEDELW